MPAISRSFPPSRFIARSIVARYTNGPSAEPAPGGRSASLLAGSVIGGSGASDASAFRAFPGGAYPISAF
jgi:hypothetical protein